MDCVHLPIVDLVDTTGIVCVLHPSFCTERVWVSQKREATRPLTRRGHAMARQTSYWNIGISYSVQATLVEECQRGLSQWLIRFTKATALFSAWGQLLRSMLIASQATVG